LGEHLVEKNLGGVLGALLGEGDLADEDVPRLGEHALLASREPSLPLTTPEVTDDLCHLEWITRGQLLQVRLVTPGPVGRFLGVRGTENVEDLAKAFLADHFPDTDDLGIFSGHPNSQVTLGNPK